LATTQSEVAVTISGREAHREVEFSKPPILGDSRARLMINPTEVNCKQALLFQGAK
jgi:hypothetical protein